MLQEFGDKNLNNDFYLDWVRIYWKRGSSVLSGVIEIFFTSSIVVCCVLNAGDTRKKATILLPKESSQLGEGIDMHLETMRISAQGMYLYQQITT